MIFQRAKGDFPFRLDPKNCVFLFACLVLFCFGKFLDDNFYNYEIHFELSNSMKCC